MKNKESILSRILFILVLAVLFIYLTVPFYWAIISSLKTESQLMMTPGTFIPRDPVTHKLSLSFQNYKAIFTNKQFLKGILNSVQIAVTVTVLGLTLGSFSAFAMGKLRFPGKTFFLYLILSMTMFPQISVLTGLYAMIRTLHISAKLSMILTYMLFTLPFTTWVLTSFFKKLPDALFQAAEVDGATPFQAFYMILLPLTLPALASTGLLTIITAWNEYLFALTFTSVDPGARTVPVAIALFSGTVSRQEPFGEIMAASIIVTIPLLLLVLIFQKKIVEGLTSGAVKG